jgi:YD repeat-containing protein
MFRDASGRLTGSQTTSGSPSGSFTGTQRDASGRLTGSSSGYGKCQGVTRVPVPRADVKKWR